MKREEAARGLAIGTLLAAIGPFTGPTTASEATRAFLDAATDAGSSARGSGARDEREEEANEDGAVVNGDAGSAGAAAAAAEQPADAIRFSFKDATFDQVLDFFSRSFDKPVIREAGVPGGMRQRRT